MFFFYSSRSRHTTWPRDWSSDVCSSDLDSGGYSWSVEIPGTQSWSAVPGSNPADLSSNLHLMAGASQTALEQGVLEAVDQESGRASCRERRMNEGGADTGNKLKYDT